MSEQRDWKKISVQIAVLAPPPAIWTALTDPNALQTWLAEHAVLEPKVGGNFAIWGQGTFGAAIPLEAPGKVVTFDEPTHLGLEYSLMGNLARVSIQIVPSEEGSTIVAEYTLPNNNESMPWYLTRDHAELFLYNLRSYAETGRPCLLPDDPAETRTPKMQITISASPSDAFAALTIPEVMDTWISTKATVDLRPGGDYLYGWTETMPDGAIVPAGPLQVLAVETDHMLTTNWRYSAESPTQVEWLIEGQSGATTVRLTHSGFGPTDDIPSYTQGWAAFLCVLKAKLQGQARVIDVPKVST